MMAPTPVAVTRFGANVERRGVDECWPWTGYSEDGYGRWFDGHRMRPAHEIALTFTTGEERLDGFDTCHNCNNPICCNPAHLRFDTRQSNVNDMTSADRHARGSRNGHHKLTESDVLAMRQRAAAGATGKSLALAYGVSPSLVTSILQGKRWRHVGGPIRSDHGNTKTGRYARNKMKEAS